MARYKVAVIAVLLKNNKTAPAGELVEENQFATKVEDLVKGGYVVKPTADEIKEWKKLHEEKADPKAEAAAAAEAAAKAAEAAKADADAKAAKDAKADADAKAAKDAKADADAAEAAKALEVKK